MRWTTKTLKTLDDLWSSGMKVPDIAVAMGYTEGSIKSKLRLNRERYPKRYNRLMAESDPGVNFRLVLPRRLFDVLKTDSKERKTTINALVREKLIEAMLE